MINHYYLCHVFKKLTDCKLHGAVFNLRKYHALSLLGSPQPCIKLTDSLPYSKLHLLSTVLGQMNAVLSFTPHFFKLYHNVNHISA